VRHPHLVSSLDTTWMKLRDVGKSLLYVLTVLAFFCMAVILALAFGTRLTLKQSLELVGLGLGLVAVLLLVRALWQRVARALERVAPSVKHALGGLLFFVIGVCASKFLADPIQVWISSGSSSARIFSRLTGAGGGWAFFFVMFAFAVWVSHFIKPRGNKP